MDAAEFILLPWMVYKSAPIQYMHDNNVKQFIFVNEIYLVLLFFYLYIET